jgi:EAL domain-containing protein (putative c-di-GMP-specific phosphodiesterase class I)
MNGRILLVEDDPPLLRAYQRTLERAGFRVEEAQDGEQALERFRQTTVDLVLSDLAMPAISGLEILRRVRANDPDIPVILMTASPAVESAAEALEHGALRYLRKPVDLDLLISTVSKAIRDYRLARAKRRALADLAAQGTTFDDTEELSLTFARGAETLWAALQPIVRWSSKRLCGYEALMRCGEPKLPHPGALLSAAERLGCLDELGRAMRARVAERIPEAPPEALLFVNLHAQDLRDDQLLSGAAPLSRYATRVVLEITERAALEGLPDLRGRMDALRALGYRIAVDDLGAGYAGLSSFTALRPDIVKVDMSLVRDVHLGA